MKTIITKEQLEDMVLAPGVEVSRTWSTKTSADDEATKVNGTMDFQGCNLKVVLGWATSDRIIARQRVERTLKEIPEKITVPAAQAGSKAPKTLEQQFEEMPPEAQEELLAKLQAAMNR